MKIYGYIYKITNKLNDKVYIGQTIRDFKQRYIASGEGIERVYKTHARNRDAGRNYNTHLLQSIERYGFDAFEVDEWFDVAYSEDELNALETYYIKQYQSDDPHYGYNGNSGGNERKPNAEARKRMAKFGEDNPFYGRHHSKETRDYLSAVKKGCYCGSANPNYGNKWTDEMKQQMSQRFKGVPNYKLRGRKMPEEVVKRQAEHLRQSYADGSIIHPRLGKHWDDDFKKHMSELMTGRYVGAKNPNSKPVLCITTGDVFETINAAALWAGVNASAISNAVKGKTKHSGKKDSVPLEWRFLNPENTHQKVS